MKRLKLDKVGPVMVVVIDTPPGRAPDRVACAELLELAAESAADQSCKAMVLLCTGALEERESKRDDPLAEDGLAAVCGALDSLEFPIVAGLQGVVLGEGANFALAAHFRLAAPGATIGWPDISRGCLAGGGGVQRLVRLGGVEVALDALLTGQPLSVDAAEEAGLVDGAVTGDLVEACVELAMRLAEAGAGPRRSRDSRQGLDDPDGFRDALVQSREATDSANNPAAAKVLECLEAALLLPFEAAVGFELAAAVELLGSEQARALTHLERAERSAVLPELVSPTRIERVGLHGGGRVAASLAFDVLATGRSVVLSEPDPAALRAGLSGLGERLVDAVRNGRLRPAERTARLERLSSATRLGDLKDCDLVLLGSDKAKSVAGFPSVWGGGRSQPLLGVLANGPFSESIVRPEQRSAQWLGLCPGSSSGRSPFWEILPPSQARAGEVAAIRDLVSDTGAVCAIARAGSSVPIVARLAHALLAVVEQVLEEGASPRQVDRALEGFGFARGPLKTADDAGLEPIWNHRREFAARRDPRARYVTVLDRLCRAGRTGRAAGQGFFDYPGEIPEGVPSAAVDRIIAAAREDAGLDAVALSDSDIVRRCHLALVLEGLRLLSDGSSRRASDIDVVAVHGLGYPRQAGGPMFRATREGWRAFLAQIPALAARQDCLFWTVPPRSERWFRGTDTGKATHVHHAPISRE